MKKSFLWILLPLLVLCSGCAQTEYAVDLGFGSENNIKTPLALGVFSKDGLFENKETVSLSVACGMLDGQSLDSLIMCIDGREPDEFACEAVTLYAAALPEAFANSISPPLCEAVDPRDLGEGWFLLKEYAPDEFEGFSVTQSFFGGKKYAHTEEVTLPAALFAQESGAFELYLCFVQTDGSACYISDCRSAGRRIYYRVGDFVQLSTYEKLLG